VTDTAQHRPIEQIAADSIEAVRLAQANDQDGLHELMRSYFLDHGWCCLFTLASALLLRSGQCLPPVPAGTPVALTADPSAAEHEILWGRMLAAHLGGDTSRCVALFHDAIDGGHVGRLMAYAVTSTAVLDLAWVELN
jgi:hypothetical protein